MSNLKLTPSQIMEGTEGRKQLYFLRHRIQKCHALVSSVGPTAVSRLQLAEIERLLDRLALYHFEGDDFKVTKIKPAVALLDDDSLFGDDIGSKARTLLERWKAGSFEPAPLTGLSGDEFSSAPDSSDEEEAAEELVNREPDIMRGICISTAQGGRKSYRLDKDFPKRPAAVFGSNGLAVGAWWPYQICALRDGAHGSRGGGIHGRVNSGAFSIVISGAYEDQDMDRGDVIFYSGSRGAPDPANPNSPPETNATQSLVKSCTSRLPVRVLRSSKCNSRWAPSVGIRYDGIYRVEAFEVKRDADGRGFYQFRLKRDDNQPPIDRRRPNPEERAAYVRLTSTP